MISWQLWDGASEKWDELLYSLSDNTVFQSFAWGEYKKGKGWTPARYFCVDIMGQKYAIA